MGPYRAPGRVDIRSIAVRLIANAHKLRQAEKSLREQAEKIVGCDLSGWTIDEVERWVDGALQQNAAPQAGGLVGESDRIKR